MSVAALIWLHLQIFAAIAAILWILGILRNAVVRLFVDSFPRRALLVDRRGAVATTLGWRQWEMHGRTQPLSDFGICTRTTM